MTATQPTRAELAYQWIIARLSEGRTVYITTHTRSTAFKAKHRDMIRVRNGCLEAQYGRQWVDIGFTKITASGE